MGNSCDTVIIGGGVHGCSIAYHLALKGIDSILLEKDHLAAGGTGRSAAGVRHQFGTEINCRLALENVKAFETLEEELNYPRSLEFTQGGYLLIAYSESQLSQFTKNVALQQSLGIQSSILSLEETLDVVPHLNPEGVLGASFCPKDGHVNPFQLSWAYAQSAMARGALIRQFTPALSLVCGVNGVQGVLTPEGEIACRNVVVAAGPWSPALLEPLGIHVPLYGERHQILVTEPTEHFLDPMVLCFEDGTYWKQVPNGSVIMGIGDPTEKKGLDVSSSWSFMEEVSEKIPSHMPVIGRLSVIRQWSGIYDITPDSQAVIGKTPVEGLLLDLGWSGHGLQFAPSIGRILAEMVAGEEPFINVDVLGYDRFEKGLLIPEPACL